MRYIPKAMLDGHQVRFFLAENPGYAAHCPWEALGGDALLRILDKHPNQPEIVAQFNAWKQLPIDDVCDLLANHPNSKLPDYCPEEIWLKFGRVHWAKLVHGGWVFVEKMKAFARDSLVSGWCCPSHWAAAYHSFYVPCAAATPRERQLARIAELSAMNPQSGDMLLGRQWGSDIARHIQWLETVAADFEAAAAMASDPACPSPKHAARHALIADAARWEIRLLTELMPSAEHGGK